MKLLNFNKNFSAPMFLGTTSRSFNNPNTFRAKCYLHYMHVTLFEKYTSTNISSNEVSDIEISLRQNNFNASTLIPGFNFSSNLATINYFKKNTYNKIPIYQTFQVSDILSIDANFTCLAPTTADITCVVAFNLVFNLLE